MTTSINISAVYQIELVRVTPNIAYKQGDKIKGVVIKYKTDNISLSGNEVFLCPVFLTRGEEDNLKEEEIENVISERNSSCFYLVNSIMYNEDMLNLEEAMVWKKYTINESASTYKIKVGKESEQTIQGAVKSEAIPFVTVVRGNNDEGTGYYIEDYYSTSLIGAIYPSLRTQEHPNPMQTAGFNVAGMPYKIPIVHYNVSNTVKFELAEIDNTCKVIFNSPKSVFYIIDSDTFELGKSKEFKISKSISDIKDMDGNIRGKIEFRKTTEQLLEPILNIVTINTDNAGINLANVITNTNGIYETMNVKWQQGKHFKVNVAYNDLSNININTNHKMRTDIYNELARQSGYSEKEYYMIVIPGLSANGNAPIGDNKFFIRPNHDNNTVPHELGHCNGLDEYAINIGIIPAKDRELLKSQTKVPAQFASTNIMGYFPMYNNSLEHKIQLKDFFSWQIYEIRRLISNRINNK